jgi:uncharacterized protein (PEP-CTERM system associated)
MKGQNPALRPRREETDRGPFRSGFRVAVVLAVVQGFANHALAQTTFTPRVTASATWTDNIELVPDEAEPEAEYIFQINPGLLLQQDTERMDSYIDYTMQNLFYLENSDRDTTYHQFDGNTSIEAVRDWFFLDALATYTQVLIDPELPISTGNLFDTANITDASSARVVPRIRHEFGAVLLDARYLRGFVDYHGNDSNGEEIEDTENEARALLIGSADKNDRLTWDIHYDQQRAEYDVSPPFEYERAGATLGWAVGSALRLLGRGGKESDLFQNLGDGGLETTYWMAGFRWSPDSNSEFEVLGGERFYGQAWEGHWTRTGRMLKLELRYSEAPTTDAQNLALRPASLDSDIDRPPDAEDFARLSPDVYVYRQLIGRLALTGSRTEIVLEPLFTRREYVATGQEERTGGLSFHIQRQIRARATIGLDLAYQEWDLRDGSEQDDGAGRISFIHRLSPTAQLTVAVAHVRREGDLPEYDASGATLRFDKEF